MATAEELNAYMAQHYPYISYNKSLAETYLSYLDGCFMVNDIEVLADMFQDYILANGLEEEIEL